MHNQYEIRYLDTFTDDLIETVDYIALTLKNPIAADNFINKVEKAILDRSLYAESFSPYPSKRKHPHPYYYIPVGNYCVFYVVIENIMEVRRLIYGPRDIDTQLR